MGSPSEVPGHPGASEKRSRERPHQPRRLFFSERPARQPPGLIFLGFCVAQERPQPRFHSPWPIRIACRAFFVGSPVRPRKQTKINRNWIPNNSQSHLWEPPGRSGGFLGRPWGRPGGISLGTFLGNLLGEAFDSKRLSTGGPACELSYGNLLLDILTPLLARY